jgi:hypothetical protein
MQKKEPTCGLASKFASVGKATCSGFTPGIFSSAHDPSAADTRIMSSFQVVRTGRHTGARRVTGRPSTAAIEMSFEEG